MIGRLNLNGISLIRTTTSTNVQGTETTAYSGRTSTSSRRTTASGSSSTRYTTTGYYPWSNGFTATHTGTQTTTGAVTKTTYSGKISTKTTSTTGTSLDMTGAITYSGMNTQSKNTLMTIDSSTLTQKETIGQSSIYFNSSYKLTKSTTFNNTSMTVDAEYLAAHYVYVFAKDKCKFGGYVSTTARIVGFMRFCFINF